MKRLTQKPVDLKIFDCPQCHKSRMKRPLDYIVSKETKIFKDRTNKEIELFIDICDTCRANNYKNHFEPTKADIRKVLNAIKTESHLDNNSLEDLL